ncbi:hypothetical protein SBOR_8935 [Sclerotinia borealis F-4128]|uniref:Uncharacterized protein n=1 Tax=Sclerotinia borealis (strain F-4128) TaxID=1432307 RepID=W9C4M1_SCLBF|nr:hypothetical protein SBOR_8935 [Sclerotinia borealis F-4128]
MLHVIDKGPPSPQALKALPDESKASEPNEYCARDRYEKSIPDSELDNELEDKPATNKDGIPNRRIGLGVDVDDFGIAAIGAIRDRGGLKMEILTHGSRWA